MNEYQISLLQSLTLEEKASLTSGENLSLTKGISRLGISPIRMSDGPHGVRRSLDEVNRIGTAGTYPAVCFPAACASASSWDKNLLRKVGSSLGKQARQAEVQVLLGPGANIKRSPLCGRNFEYFSEDPHLSSQLASAYIQGLQGEGVGASLKHFAANNQEFHRITSSSEVDERTFREIYLASFETAVKEGKPKTIMCSYNRVNGVHVSQNKEMLTGILRDDWGFEGLVVSDWGAVHDRVEALKAGCDLTMPGEKEKDRRIVDAVKSGTIDPAILDRSIQRLLLLHEQLKKSDSVWIPQTHEEAHEEARKAETGSAILLKNDCQVLPLLPEESVLFVGAFAENPRFQGGGSSNVNPFCIVSAIDAIQKIRPVEYALGFTAEDDEPDSLLESEAIQKAKKADKVVVFAGLPDSMESEGFDRTHMRLPQNQNRLIEILAKNHPNVAVVLHNGSPVEIPWAENVKAILEMYLGGEAVGEACVDLLTGTANPSGHLPETFPLRLEDNPSFLHYSGDHDRVEYREGVFVGYRNYVSTGAKVLFPFGHGLSYTKFEFSNLKTNRSTMKSGDLLEVSVDVRNVGPVFGHEVIQVYVEAEGQEIIRPKRELRAFEKVALNPGESKTVTFSLDRRAFAYWDIFSHDWRMESGDYLIEIGKNAHEPVLSSPIRIVGDPIRGRHDYSFLTVVGDLDKTEIGHEFLESVMPQIQAIIQKMGFVKTKKIPITPQEEKRRGLYSQPVSVLKRFLPQMTEQDWETFFAKLNQ